MSTHSISANDSIDLIDTNHLQLLVGPDLRAAKDLLDDLALLYIEENGPQIEQLRKTCEASDTEGTINHVHFIGGSSGNMGLMRLSRYCRDVESSLRDHKDAPSTAIFETIDQLYQCSIEAFKEQY